MSWDIRYIKPSIWKMVWWLYRSERRKIMFPDEFDRCENLNHWGNTNGRELVFEGEKLDDIVEEDSRVCASQWNCALVLFFGEFE